MAFTHGRGGGRLLFTLAVGVGAGVDCVFAQSIVRIEPPPGAAGLLMFGMSRDGRYVAGGYTNALGRGVPLRWSRDAGHETFSTPPGARLGGFAYAVANSGAIAGEIATTSSITDRFGTVWRASGELEFSAAFIYRFDAISDDGAVVTGPAPYVFVNGARIIMSPGASSVGVDVSADGGVVVGGVSTSQFTQSASIWTRAGQVFTPIGGPTGWQYNRAMTVSGDGGVLAGVSSNDLVGRSLWMWTAAQGFTVLPTPAGVIFRTDTYLRPDLNGDGSVLVCNFLGSDPRAMIWRRGEGFSRLDAFLSDAGVDLSGWTGLLVQNVSDDGLVFSGTGEYNGVASSWHAVIPGPWSALALAALAVRRRRG